MLLWNCILGQSATTTKSRGVSQKNTLAAQLDMYKVVNNFY